MIVICAGGEGFHDVREDGRLRGVEAVIDKDPPPRYWPRNSMPSYW